MDNVMNKFLFKENVKCKVSKKILSGKHDGCLEKIYDLIGIEFEIYGFFGREIVKFGNGKVISIDVDNEYFIFNLEVVSIVGKFDTRFLDLYIDVVIEDKKINGYLAKSLSLIPDEILEDKDLFKEYLIVDLEWLYKMRNFLYITIFDTTFLFRYVKDIKYSEFKIRVGNYPNSKQRVMDCGEYVSSIDFTNLKGVYSVYDILDRESFCKDKCKYKKLLELHLSGSGFKKIGFLEIKDVKIGSDGVDIVIETFTNVKVDDLEILKLGLDEIIGFVRKKKEAKESV